MTRCVIAPGSKRVKKAPTAAIIDSQSIKMVSQPGERGFDAGKKICGRKGHLLVDTLGLILGCVVHQAGLQDRDGAKLLEPFLLRYGWLKAVFVDGGYAGRSPTGWLRCLDIANSPPTSCKKSTPIALWRCPSAGSSNAPSLGSATSDVSPRTMK